jgi:hypothetical protein
MGSKIRNSRKELKRKQKKRKKGMKREKKRYVILADVVWQSK